MEYSQPWVNCWVISNFVSLPSNFIKNQQVNWAQWTYECFRLQLEWKQLETQNPRKSTAHCHVLAMHSPQQQWAFSPATVILLGSQLIANACVCVCFYTIVCASPCGKWQFLHIPFCFLALPASWWLETWLVEMHECRCSLSSQPSDPGLYLLSVPLICVKAGGL